MKSLICSLLLALPLASGLQAETPELPPFDELRKIILSNVDGADGALLNQSAGEAALEAFGNRVSIVSNQGGKAAEGPFVSRSEMIGTFGYLHLGQLEEGAAQEFDALIAEWQKKELNGIVLDLRFTRGFDYEEAVSIANRFLNKDDVMLHLGRTALRATIKGAALQMPVVVLMNAQTTGAPEALGALLRHHSSGVLVGSDSAGAAHFYRTVKTSNGLKLRVANGSIRLGDSLTLTTDGLTPDVKVKTDFKLEKEWIVNPRLQPTKTTAEDGEDLFGRPGTERELVRRHNEINQRIEKSDDNGEEDASGEDASATSDEIHDPVLIRALDLLKAFSIVKGR